MKIAKGHYVPKELITSEAVHEAVVKCFVAAGFKDIRPSFGKYGGAAHGDIGLGVYSDGDIFWTDGSHNNEIQITLQQLFTAENGLCWPDWADCIDTDGKAVWFHGRRSHELIAGEVGTGPVIMTLATHQPKEREVKNEALDKAVIELSGAWPSSVATCTNMKMFKSKTEWRCSTSPSDCLFTKSKFNQRAKELGYINGYRWGVEYQVNGKRPDLPDDVRVELRYSKEGIWFDKTVADSRWLVGGVASFRITDPRYKPADTSYLNASAQPQSLTHSEEGLTHKRDPQSVSESSESKCEAENVSEWWDYENDKAIKLPPVGAKCEVEFSNPRFGWSGVSVDYIGKDIVVVTALTDGDEVVLDSDEGNFISKFRPLDHATRKAEMEKKKAVEQGAEILCEAYKAMGKDEPYFYQYMEALYAAGWRQTK